MKNIKKSSHGFFVALALLACSILDSGLSTLFAQGTVFTYQGRLNNGTNPANGNYDMTFALYNASTSGSQIGSTLTTLAVGVTNGLFFVTNDFGAVYNGTPYWLQIGVRTNGGNTFSPLSPRQALTPTPYAVYAENAGSTALVSDPGTQNFFAGQSAGNQTLAGTHNTGVGYGALTVNQGGDYNTATGTSALGANTTGGANTAAGAFALEYNQIGGNNTAYGADTLSYNVSGSFNTATGVAALEYTTVGANTAYGFVALGNDTTGSNNTAVGYEALQNSKTDHDLVAIGYEALQNDNALNNGVSGSGTGENTAVGYEALQADTTGSANTAMGYQALYQNTNGYNNTAIGDSALHSNTSGVGNTALGEIALFSAMASYNTATGYGAISGPFLGTTTGSFNTANGAYALVFDSTGSNNVAVGSYASYENTTGGGNTVVGASSLSVNQAGYNNTIMGYDSFADNSDSVDNVAIGVATFQVATEGNLNTAVGTYAFQQMSAGDDNIGIGYHAGFNLNAGSNNIFIGNLGAANDNNVIRIGTPGTQTTTYIAGTAVGINNSNPTAALDVAGEFIVVEGLTPLRCYLGDDGAGNDVQVGSLTHGITAVSLYNEADSSYMNLFCSNITSKATTCTTITITGGSDLAEPFEISNPSREIPEGSVVVIDEANPGHLKISNRPYDTRVAGVLSGANGIHPGIQMLQQGLIEGGKNVALTGRVYVQADASNGAIKPGDLLTTSSSLGRAMRVSNHSKAEGAILGKAMTGLNKGQGMVLVLVTLQ